MAKKGYIYKYTYPNGKVFIGSTTVSVKESHYQHMCASRNPHRWTLCDWAIYVYGEPTVETIETIEVADNEGKKLNELLKKGKEKWIKHYDSTIESGKGLNVRGGGRMIHWEDYALHEECKKIYEEEWEEKTDHVVAVLESIGTKLCTTKEKLTKEEEDVWHNMKFKKHYLTGISEEHTFCSFYEDEMSDGGINKVTYFTEAFESIMNQAMEHWGRDIWEAITIKAKEQNEALADLIEMREEKKREGIDKAQFKRNLSFLSRAMK